MYDRMLASTEQAGLAEMRAELLRGATGETLEIGAGTGLNLAHYPQAVTSLTVTEPDPHMAKRLRARADELAGSPSLEVIEAPAEELPFGDDSFDTVVATLVFCTVGDPERATAEVARVVRPDGRVLVLEHVRAVDNPARARWQDRLERPWGWIAAGCHPNRDTAASMRRAGLELDLEPAELPKAPPIVRPMIRGAARPAQASEPTSSS